MTVLSSGSVTIEYDNSPGGSLVDMTDHIQSEFIIGIVNVMQDIKAKGDTTPQSVPSGNVEMEDIVFRGFWDDATNGPEEIFRLQADDKSPFGDTRSLRVTIGSSLQLDVETRLVNYRRIRTDPGALLYEATIRPVGDLTETDL